MSKISGHGSQWISNKINIRQPGQLKKWKSWEPFWSYQRNSTANPAHLLQIWPNFWHLLFIYKQCELYKQVIDKSFRWNIATLNLWLSHIHNSVPNDLSFVIWIKNKILQTDYSAQPFKSTIIHVKIRNARIWILNNFILAIQFQNM